jgi:tRNA threonylcarbamoyladenosine biosynthesis protein TsaB
MIVLGFDTSTPSTVVGLRLAAGVVLEARDDAEGQQRPGHATRLLPLASDLLSEAGLGWGAVERIAVGVGPGTFTGLRIGVATARGLAQSLGVELVGVSSLLALAHAVRVDGSDDESGVLAVLDARRGEMFVAAFRGEQQVLEPHAVSPGALEELLERPGIDCGAERWIAVGNGAVLYREAIEQLGVRVPDEDSASHRAGAPAICDLGAHQTVHPTGDAPGLAPSAVSGGMSVVPDYRRRPDAEIALEGVAS